MNTKQRRGRPRFADSSEKKDQVVRALVTRSEYLKIERLAQRAQQTISAWARNRLVAS